VTSAHRHESESRLGSSTDASRATGKPRRSTRRPRNLSEASGVTTHTKDLSVVQGNGDGPGHLAISLPDVPSLAD
jgi:hypothetical protein